MRWRSSTGGRHTERKAEIRKVRHGLLRRLEQALMDRAYVEAYKRFPDSGGWGALGALMLAKGFEDENSW
jgi:hypothetical protein